MISLKGMQHALFPTAIASPACKNFEYMGYAQIGKWQINLAYMW